MTLHGRRAWTEKTPPPTEPLALGGRGQEGRGQPEAQRGRGEHVESPASNSPCLPPPRPRIVLFSLLLLTPAHECGPEGDLHQHVQGVLQVSGGHGEWGAGAGGAGTGEPG